MRSLLLVAVLALVAGGLFLVLGGDSSPHAPDGSDPTRRAMDGGGSAPAVAVSDLVDVDSVDPGRAEAPALTSELVAPARNQAGQPEGAAVEDGMPRGAVFGRVTDAEGAPIAAADVSLENSMLSFVSADGTDPDAATTTDDDGRFRLEPWAGQYALRIGCDGFGPFEQTTEVSPGSQTNLGDIQLARGVRISGRVLNDRGQPVEGARIARPVSADGGFMVLGGTGEVVARTGADGRFEIRRQAPGPFEFFVHHDEYPRESIKGSTTRAGESLSGIEVVLRIGARITGQVTGALEEGLRVTARPRGNQAAAMAAFDLAEGVGARRRTGQVQPDGSFTVQGLEEQAEYELWIEVGRRDWGASSRRSERILARSGDAGVLLPYSEGAAVRWTLRGPGGEPVAKADVSGGTRYKAPLENLEIDESTATYTARHLWPAKDGAAFQLQFEARGYETYALDRVGLIPGETTDLGLISLEPKPQLVVTVVEAGNGRAVEGARVEAEEYQEPLGPGMRQVRASFSVSTEEEEGGGLPSWSMSDGSATTDEEGICSLDVTPGKRIWIDVTHPGFAEQRAGPVELPADETQFELRVELAPGGSVEVLVLDHEGQPLPGAGVEVRADDGRPKRDAKPTGGQGKTLFQGLAIGTYGFRLARSGASSMVMVLEDLGGPKDESGWSEAVVLPGERTALTLTAPEPTSLEGRITEAGVPLVGAKVRLRSAAADDPFAGLGFALGGAASATTDATGRYRLDDVEAGSRKIVVDHDTRAMSFEERIELDAGENERDLDLSITTIEGRVFGPDGDPQAGAKVEAKRAGGSTGTSIVSFVIAGPDDSDGAAFVAGDIGGPDGVYTDGEGRYVLRGVQPEVELVVEASKKGLDRTRSEPLELSSGDARRNVDLAFVQTGSLTIEVEGGGTGLMAILRRRGEGARDPRIERFDGPSTTIEGLQPGRWVVSINDLGMGGEEPQEYSPSESVVDVVGDETATVQFEAQD